MRPPGTRVAPPLRATNTVDVDRLRRSVEADLRALRRQVRILQACVGVLAIAVALGAML